MMAWHGLSDDSSPVRHHPHLNPSHLMKSLITLLCVGLASLLRAGTATIEIDPTSPGPPVNPRMYGIFLEEINHGVDGGLYAELIANRAFEDSRPPEGFTCQGDRFKDAKGYDSGFAVRAGDVPRWSLVADHGAMGSLHIESTGGLNAESPYCLRLDAVDTSTGRFGVANGGFWGIGVASGECYDLILHVRAGAGFSGSLAVGLESPNGSPCSEILEIHGVEATWKPFKASFKATKSEAKARLVILVRGHGSVRLDWISLMPQVTWKNHGLRPDIAGMIADLKPGFVRWPGGCVVEGGTVESAYDWKLGIGAAEARPECWTAWNHRRTHGLGLFEYLRFCEDLGAKPLYVGFAGQTCLFREAENVPMEKMAKVTENFAGAIEFARGDVTTKYGALRAMAGHPAPFDLDLVEIGNENGTVEFPPRYRMVHAALKMAYPDINTIADLSWISREMMKDCAFDIEDVHYYSPSRWFINNHHMYDQRDRKLPPVYLGELATTSSDGGDLKGNLLAALAEGVFMLGCERNSDVVRMISYAPLLSNVQRVNGWHAMIYHDSTRAFGTASYYLWKLFGENLPARTVKTRTGISLENPATLAGGIGIGTWNTSAEFKDIRVTKDGKELVDAGPWTAEGGSWTNENGLHRQSEPVVGLNFHGDPSWTDYTLAMKARKLAGEEGFLIVFGHKEAEMIWWNIGGWGNQKHGLEINRQPMGQGVAGSIDTGRWYDIKVELSCNRIRCFLDNQLIHDEQVPRRESFFASAGIDAKSGEWILKAINLSDEPIRGSIRAGTAAPASHPARCTVLTADSLAANNSMDEPTRIVPVSRMVDFTGAHDFAPRSLTILRWKSN